MLETALLAIGFVCLAEGLAYALAPSLVERLLAALARVPIPVRRQLGLLVAVSGVLVLWLARALGA